MIKGHPIDQCCVHWVYRCMLCCSDGKITSTDNVFIFYEVPLFCSFVMFSNQDICSLTCCHNDKTPRVQFSTFLNVLAVQSYYPVHMIFCMLTIGRILYHLLLHSTRKVFPNTWTRQLHVVLFAATHHKSRNVFPQIRSPPKISSTSSSILEASREISQRKST